MTNALTRCAHGNQRLFSQYVVLGGIAALCIYTSAFADNSKLIQASEIVVLSLDKAGTTAIGNSNLRSADDSDAQAIGGTRLRAIGGTHLRAIGGTRLRAADDSDAQAIGGTRLRAIGGTHLRAIGGTRLRAADDSDAQAIGGTRLRAIGGTRLRAIGGTRLRAMSSSSCNRKPETIGGTHLRAIGGTRLRTTDDSGVQAIGGTRLRAIGGTRLRAIGGTRLRTTDDSGIQAIEGTRLRDIESIVDDLPIGRIDIGPATDIDLSTQSLRMLGRTIQVDNLAETGIGENQLITVISCQGEDEPAFVFSSDEHFVPGASEILLTGVVTTVRRDIGALEVNNLTVDYTALMSTNWNPDDIAVGSTIVVRGILY